MSQSRAKATVAVRPHSVDSVKFLLLDMISSVRSVDTAFMASLSPKDWDSLRKMASQHRLEPLLHHQLATVGSAWVVPAEARSCWAAGYRQAALRSLSVQLTLQGIDRLLKQAGIPYAALKGAWLAWHAYPHPALRPMRDVDILVQPEQTLDAFDVLLAGGFLRLAQDLTPPAHAFEQHRHLPPIADPRTSICVEVHSRLVDHGHATAAGSTVKQLSSSIGAMTGGTAISYLSREDSLLHLIVHSVYEHQFNNGPAVLNDVAMLLKSGPLDWDHFWAAACSQRQLPGCSLIFAMAEHYHGDLGIAWPADRCNRPPSAVLEAAALMTLQDFDNRSYVKMATDLGSGTGVLKKLGLLFQRVGTSRFNLAKFSGLSPQSRLIWLCYPAWLVTRMFKYTRPLMMQSARAETERGWQVLKWLDADNLTDPAPL